MTVPAGVIGSGESMVRDLRKGLWEELATAALARGETTPPSRTLDGGVVFAEPLLDILLRS